MTKNGIQATAYAAFAEDQPLRTHSISRRAPGPKDCLIEIHYCGICHSDIHQARNEWEGSSYPMVPGHEIAGIVVQTGKAVKKFKNGDRVGVGCFVDSCRKCEACLAGEEQYCEKGASFTYNSFEQDKKTPTFGGYSQFITVDEKYILKLPKSVPLANAAPLLCAGITTYSPLKTFGVKRGDQVAVVGLGGLGHMGVKLAKAMGAKVTVLSHTASKKAAALKLGADFFLDTAAPDFFKKNAGRFDFILDTVSAVHDYNAYLGLLKRDATMVLVGMPDPTPLDAASLVMKRRRLAGSLIGGIRQTQEMLDFCGKHRIGSEIEIIPPSKINEAYERVLKSDVRYRFVIDLKSNSPTI